MQRQYLAEQAQILWSEVVNKLALKHHYIDYTINDFTTRLCYLADKNHFTVRGSGKGATHHDINASASFEALEHFLSSSASDHLPIINALPSEIFSTYPVITQRYNAELFMQQISKHKRPMPWAIYEDFISKEKYVAPLATIDLTYDIHKSKSDTFNYYHCQLYSCTNGLSSGSTYEESVIHGILELIERDAYSFFLVDTCFLKKQPRIIAQETLPVSLLDLITKIEKNFHSKIVIYQMPSRLGVPCFLASLLDSKYSVRPRGLGASLNAVYALERALYELIESYLLMYGNYCESEINKSLLKNNTLMEACLQLELPVIIDRQELFALQINEEKIPANLPDYLNKLIGLIQSQCLKLLVYKAYEDENGITCTSVKIPELEEFYALTHYVPLKFTSQMMAYIRQYTDKLLDSQTTTT